MLYAIHKYVYTKKYYTYISWDTRRCADLYCPLLLKIMKIGVKYEWVIKKGCTIYALYEFEFAHFSYTMFN